MAEDMTLRLEDHLCFALYTATHAVTRAYRPLLQDVDLTYPQYLVMLVLWQDGKTTSGAIAERLHLSANAISPLLDRLEQSGLIARRRDGRDRRVVHIELTSAGLRLEMAAREAQDALAGQMGLAPALVNRLMDDLTLLVRRMTAAPTTAAE